MAINAWAGILSTTIKDHMMEVVKNTHQRHILTALLKRRGKIKMNCFGESFDWRVKKTRAAMQGYQDMDSLTYPRRNRNQVAALSYVGFTIPETYSKFEMLANRGKARIIDLVEDRQESVREDMDFNFELEFYKDGIATAGALMGFESCLARHSSATGAGGKTRDPDDNYAGIDTDLAGYGGSWSGDWPDGTGDVLYNFWSPVLVDTTASVWGTSPSFASYGDKQIRFGIRSVKKFTAMDNKIDTVLMTDSDFNSFIELQEVKERINTNRGQNSLLISLGFGDAINFEGTDIMWSVGVPASTIYGFNSTKIELRSMQSDLFKVNGPVEHIPSKSWIFDVDFFGQLKLNPHDMVKWYPYT